MSLTIKDLKEAIANLKDDAVVSFLMASGCCGDHEYLEIQEGFEYIVYQAQRDGDVDALSFYFNPLPGYKSCIQAGSTLKADEEYWKDKK